MAIKIYGPNKIEQRGGVGEGTKASPFYWYGKLVEDNPCVTGSYDNSDSFNEMDYTAEPIWVRVYLDAETTYTIGQTCYGSFALCDEEFNSLVKADSNEQEISGVYCAYCLTYTPETSGVYLLKSGVTSGYPEQYKLCFNVAPNATDEVPAIYDYQLTSAGFDNYGLPIKYRSLMDAGLLPFANKKEYFFLDFTNKKDDGNYYSNDGKYKVTLGESSEILVLDKDSATNVPRNNWRCIKTERLDINDFQSAIVRNGEPFTFDFWMMIPSERFSSSQHGNCFGGGHFDVFRFGYNFYTGDSKQVNNEKEPYIGFNFGSYYYNAYSNIQYSDYSPVPYTLDRWFHLAFILDGTNGDFKYYQDGKLVYSYNLKGCDYVNDFISSPSQEAQYLVFGGHNRDYNNRIFYLANIRITKGIVWNEDFAPPLK
jgi:hypothetical protein